MAERARKEARASGAVGRTDHHELTRSQKVQRDTAIILGSRAGIGVKQLAADYEITVGAVRAILAGEAELPSPLDRSALKQVEDFARVYRRELYSLRHVAAEQIERNPAIALGAMRLARDTLRDWWELLAQVGQLPKDLETFRTEEELRQLVIRLRGLLEQAAAGEIEARVVLEEWDRALDPARTWDVEASAEELPRVTG